MNAIFYAYPRQDEISRYLIVHMGNALPDGDDDEEDSIVADKVHIALDAAPPDF